MRNLDAATIGQLHPQGSIPLDHGSADRSGAADKLHGKNPVLHPSDEDRSLGTPLLCGLRLRRRRLQGAETLAILIQSRDRQSMSRAEVPPRQSALRKLQNQTLGRFTASTTTHDNNTHFAHAIRTSQNHNITKDVLALTHTLNPFEEQLDLPK